MISIKEIQPVLPVKLRKDFKNFVVYLDNIFHAAVLPEFVPVTKFDVRISSLVIIL